MIERLEFLRQSGALVVAFAVGAPASTPAPAVAPKPPGASEANPKGPVIVPRVDSWIAIDTKGNTTVFFGKVELGTGVETAVAQLAADELYVPFASVHVIAGDTSRTPNQGYTAGSQTLSNGAVAVRQAAGTARAKLVALGAAHLGADASALSTRDGVVFVTATPAQRVTYAELIGGRQFDEDVPKNPPMRDQTTFTISGTSVPRVDIPGKIYGKYTYVQDLRIPKMQHGRVIYPPGPGATLTSYDAKSIAALPEHVRIVRKGNFLGVVAKTEWHAVRAARELKVVWANGPALPAMAKLPETIRAIDGAERTLVKTGDLEAAIKSGKALAATYTWPYQSHGSIGPSCSIADVTGENVTVWSATQGVFPLRGAIAEMLERPAAAVRVIYVEGAGCYGQNGADDSAAAAALLSREVGAPVRVQYMRVDETRWDPKGPAMVMSHRGSIDAGGTITGWGSHIWSPTHSSRPDGFAGNLYPALLAGTAPAKITFVGGDRDGMINYNVAAKNMVITDQKMTVLHQSAMRGLGGTQNTFAIESFMDELAHLAGANPLEFRLKHLTDDRERASLDALQPYYKKGRGLSWVHYENKEAIVGVVADVTVNTKTGTVRVNDLWISHDCGLIVNPDGLRNQIEGNAIQATSRALMEEVRFDRHDITSVDWDTYPILRFGEIPTVSIALLDRRDKPVLGAGEATTTAIAPAIANAIFAQTGARLRGVPFTPKNVLAALHEKSAAPA